MKALLFVAALLAGCATTKKPNYQVGFGFVKPQYSIPFASVKSSARGVTDISANEDFYLTGTVHVVGIIPSSAYIELDGKSIVKLTRITRDDFVVPIGTYLTESQYTKYLAGHLIVKVNDDMYARLSPK